MSKSRSLVSQLCACFPYYCLQFTNGSVTGFQIILIAELYKKDSEIPATLEQLSWFASLDIFKLVGSLITGLLLHRLGNRLVGMTTALTFITSCLLYHYSTSANIVFVSRTLSTLLSVYPLCPPYISEISEPHLRSSFLAIAELSVSAGIFFSLLLGSLLYWRTVALINIIFPILAAVALFVVPNSPTWLASKGRMDEAQKSLCWLRGWVEPEKVETEFRALRKRVETSVAEHKHDVESVSCEKRSRQFFRLFLQRSFYVPLATVCLIFLLYSFSGIDTMDNYATVVFRQLDSPIEESTATAIMGAMGTVGNVLLLLFIRRTGKRKLVFFSVVVTGLCHIIIAIVGFLELRGQSLWIPPIALIVGFFANALGIGTINYMLPSEIFPSSIRYVGTSIGISVKMILKSIMNKLFLYLVDAIALSGVFLFFAVVNVVALVTYYFLFPETEGKSLDEIEHHFKSGKNAKELKR